MTTSRESNEWSGLGNGVATTFSIGERVQDASHLTVYLVDTTTEVATLQVLGTDYTLSGVNEDPGCTGTFVTAPPTGTRWVAQITPPLTQTANLRSIGGRFNAVIHEDALDRLNQQIRRIWSYVQRSPHQPLSETIVDNQLPSKSERLGKLFGWHSTTGAPIAVSQAAASSGGLLLPDEVTDETEVTAVLVQTTGNEGEETTSWIAKETLLGDPAAQLQLTVDTALTADQLLVPINNYGATALTTHHLPEAVVGRYAEFNRIADYNIRLQPATGERFREGSANEYLEVLAGTVTIKCIVAGIWDIVSSGDANGWRLENGYSGISEYLGVINVLHYGAKFDGVTDDGPAINAANDAAFVAKKPVLYPAGTAGILTPVLIKAPMVCSGGNSPRTNNLIPLYGTRFLNLGITGTTANIAGITVGTTTTITTTAAHGFTTGTPVYITGITGTQLNGCVAQIVVTGTTTFTLTDTATTGYTAWSSGGTVTSLPAVVELASDVAGSEVSRGFRVDGGFAVDGAGYTCTGFYAPGDQGVNYMTRYSLENMHTTGCIHGMDITGFTGEIRNCYALKNTRAGLVLKKANSVNITGGEYAPADSLTSWGIRLISGESTNFHGVNIQGDVADLGNGLDIAEGCLGVHFSGYTENMAGDASTVSYHIRVGAMNRYGGEALNTLAVAAQEFSFGTLFAGASATEAVVYGSLGPRIHLGNVVGVDLGSSMFSTKNLEISQYARDIRGAMAGQQFISLASPSMNGYSSSHYVTDESGAMGRPALSLIPTLDFRGSAANAIRGFKEVVRSTGITTALETTITRNGLSSLKITATGGVAGDPARCIMFPFGQGAFAGASPGQQIVLTGWIYVPSGAVGAPNECYSLNGSANLRYPSVGFEYDIGAGRDSAQYVFGVKSAPIYIGYYGLNKWTQFFVFQKYTGLTELGVAIKPLDVTAADTGSGVQDHSVYVSDLALVVNPQSWKDLMGGGFSLDPRSGLFIGDQFFCSATAAPTDADTYWARGDTVINSAPAVGAPDRWVCTTAGVGGTATFTATANL